MTGSIDHGIFDVASTLEVPVLVLALASLAAALFQLGSYLAERYGRRRRRFEALAAAVEHARRGLRSGDTEGARRALDEVAWSGRVRAALHELIVRSGEPMAEPRLAKLLADFDYDSQRRLALARLLVRAGPALGLMGTLIPLSPALDGLARGDVGQLSQNLRVAFSVTVVGLITGAIAFGIALSRDRLYGQDLSDLEYAAAMLSAPDPVGEVA